MSTYFKFIIIAALFLTNGAASVLGESENGSSATRDQEIVEQSTSQEETKSASSTTKDSGGSIESNEDGNQITTQSSSVNPAATANSGASNTDAHSAESEA